MNQKWNLQDIKPSEPRKKRPSGDVEMTARPQPPRVSREEAEDIMSIDIVDGNKKKSRAVWYGLILFFVILAVGAVVSIMTAGAEVTVHPKHSEPTVDADFTAVRNPQPDQLAYEIMSLDAQGEQQIKASGQKQVQSNASGSILIYNKFKSSPVHLIAHTRFADPNGLIFRISKPVTIPGYTKDASGKIIPGVVTADVTADQPGQDYNIGPSHFTIPGLKGDAEYSAVYAESVQSFTGGFDGKKFIIDNTELETAQQKLRTQLRNSLLDKIDSKKPAGFVVYKDAVTFTYQSLPSVSAGDNLATIKEKVTMRIPMFKQDQFAQYIAKATVPGYNGAPVRIVDPYTMTFSYTSATTSATDISALDSINFHLKGQPQIVWKYDAEKLKADLANAPKSSLTSILGSFPAIQKAEATIRPFWKTRFPVDINKIKVTESIP